MTLVSLNREAGGLVRWEEAAVGGERGGGGRPVETEGRGGGGEECGRWGVAGGGTRGCGFDREEDEM